MPATERTWREAVVADDDPFFRLALASVLSDQFGVRRVVQAGTFDDALERLTATPTVDLALFDLAMPGIASPANLAAVRECHPDVTTVVVSNSVRREDVFLALRAGVHGFVSKCMGVEALIRALGVIREGFVLVPSFVAHADGSAAAGPSAAATRNDRPCLSLRQRQVLDLIADGRSNKEIARTLYLGEGTVKIHVTALLRAIGVSNRSAAAAWAAANRERTDDKA